MMFDFLTSLYEVHVYFLNSKKIVEYRTRMGHYVRIKVLIHLFFAVLGLELGTLCRLETLCH